jgi:hypothetical protein
VFLFYYFKSICAFLFNINQYNESNIIVPIIMRERGSEVDRWMDALKNRKKTTTSIETSSDLSFSKLKSVNGWSKYIK